MGLSCLRLERPPARRPSRSVCAAPAAERADSGHLHPACGLRDVIACHPAHLDACVSRTRRRRRPIGVWSAARARASSSCGRRHRVRFGRLRPRRVRRGSDGLTLDRGGRVLWTTCATSPGSRRLIGRRSRASVEVQARPAEHLSRAAAGRAEGGGIWRRFGREHDPNAALVGGCADAAR